MMVALIELDFFCETWNPRCEFCNTIGGVFCEFRKVSDNFASNRIPAADQGEFMAFFYLLSYLLCLIRL